MRVVWAEGWARIGGRWLLPHRMQAQEGSEDAGDHGGGGKAVGVVGWGGAV